jgi:alpha-beta hydrolase superfamily lysophospholipase
MHVGAPVKQHIQYATSSDGVRIAYAVMGQGTPVVRASHWLTHLEYELDSPVWRHLILGMASRHQFIRYDGRGTGLSQRDGVDISMDRWVSDLECIVDSLSLERFILLGVSQGGAISIQYGNPQYRLLALRRRPLANWKLRDANEGCGLAQGDEYRRSSIAP